MGPSTLMWRWPLVLVAAIFQPTTASPLAAARARWAVYPSAMVRGLHASGSVSMTSPFVQHRRMIRPTSSACFDRVGMSASSTCRPLPG